MDEQTVPLLSAGSDELTGLKEEIIILKHEKKSLLDRLNSLQFAFALTELKNFREREKLVMQINSLAQRAEPYVPQDAGPRNKDSTTESMSHVPPPVGEKETIDHLMRRLELEGMDKVRTLMNSGLTIDNLIKVLEDGDAEFTEHTNRHMTYGEMRSVFG